MRNRLIIILGSLFGGLLFLAILLFCVAQMDFFQDFLIQKIAKEAKAQGIMLETRQVKALAPFKWNSQKVSMKLEDGTFVEADGVRFKISPFSLVSKKLTIRSLSAEKVHVSFTPAEDSSSWELPSVKNLKTLNKLSFKLPFDMYAKSILCSHIVLENLKTHEMITLSFSGSAKVDKEGKEINIDFLLQELAGSNYLEVVAIASNKHKHLEATLELKLLGTQKLSNFFALPPLPSLHGICKVHGGYSHPLFFQVESHIDSLTIPNTTCTVRALDFEAIGEFFLKSKSPEFLSLQRIQIKDSSLNLLGSCTLSSQFKPLTGQIDISCTKDSQWACFLPIHGEMDAKVHLDASSFSASLHSPSLTIGKETFEPADFELLAKKEEERWEGSSEGSFLHPILPSKESCRFILEKDKLEVFDFFLHVADAKIGGNAEYLLSDSSYAGAFFIMAEELRPLRLLFPQSDIDGRLGGSFEIQGTKQDLSLDLSCTLKSIRYKNSLVDSMQLEAEVDKLLTAPSGKLSCDAKNIFFKDMLLSNVSIFSEAIRDGFQTFSLFVDGDWKQELHFESQGLWKKEGPLWTIRLNECKGSFLSESFSLENSFTIEQSKEEFLLEHCLWKIGGGELETQFHLTKDKVEHKGEGSHLPLGILGVLYPKMAFQGMTSFQSSLTGPVDDLKGHFFLTLERADFSQNRAKGSLQLHVNSSGVQMYTHLYATSNQFLDCTATLPLNYSFAPFSWQFDKTRPVTSELRVQGAVEEIFDFVNTASHKATGWVTAHLFLSGMLEDPALLGSLKCQQGSYQNYFTGTQLKDISAQVEASGHLLELTSLNATDEKEGKLSSTGSLTLSPQEHFPFELKSHLEKMHSVHTDLLDASLSGFLKISGSTQSMTASGDLTVDRAVFKIFEELPYEVPTLPVTYINKPIHMQTDALQSAPPYPFYLDVQLSAEDSVFVEGKGLDSNWQGNVHLSGTLAAPAGNGALNLKRGEFTFSGKKFTLMHGEISFFDKPSPGAYLKLNGELPLPTATILAQMQGPLTSPQLTFQSIPSLPISSILSLILFNKDISEISPLQALQLAQTIVSLSGSGGGPGVLESIRKKIGVDRLTIVGKDGKAGTDEISVQIGWYLNHGITLSLSQSATSSDVTVEVDLKNGFIFQAETQNQEEGKFSFKWNKNY